MAPPVRTKILGVALTLSVMGACLPLGCSGQGDENSSASPSHGPAADSTVTPGQPQGACASPAEGCSCTIEGEAISCEQKMYQRESYIYCAKGTRTCSGGVWGKCQVEGGTTTVKTAPAVGYTIEGLGASQQCLNNPCDPYCNSFSDNPSGLNPTSPLLVGPSGMTLTPNAPAVQQTFTGLYVDPNPGLITVTQIPDAAAPVQSPSPLDLNAFLIPSGGGPGVATSAAWDLDFDDTAAINGNGQVSVYVPVARVLKATAKVGSFSASAPVKIVVNVNEVGAGVSNATVAKFGGAPTGTDPATILYPYNNTTFPRGITPPVVQWSNGGQAADGVKITLRYLDAAAGVDFTWSRIVLENNPDPKFAIPSKAWWPFDQTAAGKVAQLKVQRVIGGQLRPEIVYNVRFSTEPLRGTIYYWEINQGSIAKIDAQTGQRTPQWLSPWAGKGRCVACHSVSADGSTIVVQHDGGNGPGGVYNAYTGAQKYDRGGVSAQWQAISPTGKWNIWGDSGNLSLSNGPSVYASLQGSLDAATGASGYTTGPNIMNAAFSPDGKKVAFASRSTGYGAWSGWWWGNWDAWSWGWYPWSDRYGMWPPRWWQPWDWWPSWDYGYWVTSDYGLYANNWWWWGWGTGWGIRTGWGNFWAWGYSADPGWVGYYNPGFGFSSGWGWGGSPWNGWGHSISPGQGGWHWGGDWASLGTGWSTGNGYGPWWYVDFNSSALWVADFQETWPYFTNVKQIVASNIDRPVATFPTFTPDGQWIAYQRADKVRTRDHVGEIWLVSVDGSKQIQLTNTDGQLAPGHLTWGNDQSTTYEPTFNPQASGGYNWIVATSNRSYGNTLKPCGYQPSCGIKQMWVSAVSTSPQQGTDPSSPAFWLPGQELNNQNMRGFWAKSPCRPTGSVCSAQEDCCGYTGNPATSTAACRIQLVNGVPTFPLQNKCTAIVPGQCSATGASCSTDGDCCKFGAQVDGEKCTAGTCQKIAPPIVYKAGTFTRDYAASCPSGSNEIWRLFEWKATTPGDSSIVLSAQTASTTAGLAAAPSVPLGVVSTANGNVSAVAWNGVDVGAKLAASGNPSQDFVRISMVLTPSSDATTAPTLIEWRQGYSCPPSE